MTVGLASVSTIDPAAPALRERRRARSSAIRLMLYIAQGAIDVSAAVFGFVFANIIRYDAFRAENLQLLLLAIPIFLFVSFYARVYSVASFQSYAQSIGRSVGALIIVIALILTVAFATRQSFAISRSVTGLGFILASVLLILGRLPLVALVRHRLAGDIVRRVVVIDDVAVEVPASFERVTAHDRGLTPDLHNPVSLSDFFLAGDRLRPGCSRVPRGAAQGMVALHASGWLSRRAAASRT